MPKLSQAEIDTALQELSGWSHAQEAIRKQYQFDDFKQAISFVNRVAEVAEAADHHPDVDIRYNKVAIALATHSEGGITSKDIDLARQIEAAVGS